MAIMVRRSNNEVIFNRKKIISLIALLLSLSGAFADVHLKNADEIVGLYWSPKKDAKIEIFKRGNRYYGRSIWVASMRKDTKNPDETLKNREVLGIELLTGFTFNDDFYTDGKIYDPESGKTYDCRMSLTDKILKVRGYIGISLFGRTETFERIK
ncbi:MAG TPA: DUF2147 domain-containing protein [Chitinophagaceae bacterium]|nr:DUF2147 domain-containing protein [Chitinophagaceae bacterium]